MYSASRIERMSSDPEEEQIEGAEKDIYSLYLTERKKQEDESYLLWNFIIYWPGFKEKMRLAENLACIGKYFK
jgi:hypothetical protein